MSALLSNTSNTLLRTLASDESKKAEDEDSDIIQCPPEAGLPKTTPPISDKIEKLVCLVCLIPLLQNDSSSSSDASTATLSQASVLGPTSDKLIRLTDFCDLLQIVVKGLNTRSLSVYEMGTPLCERCQKEMMTIRTLVHQIKELETTLAATRRMVKDRVTASEHTIRECDKDATDASYASTDELECALDAIRKSVIAKSYSKAVVTSSHNKRGRRPGKKTPTSATIENETVEAPRKDLTSRKSSFGRVVKRPRHYINSENEESEGEVEKKFDPPASDQRHNFDESIPMSIVKVEMAQSVKSTKNTNSMESTSTTTPTMVDSKTEPKPTDDETEFQNRMSDDNWSDGADSAEQVLEEEGPLKKRKYARKIKGKKTQLLMSSSSTLTGSNKRPATESLKRVQLEPSCGTEMRQASASEESAFSNNAENRAARMQKKKNGQLQNAESLKVECGECQRRFSNERKKELHIMKAHKGLKEGYECRSCDKKFTKLKDFNHHRKAEHPPKDSKVDPSGRRLFQCDVCKIDFKNYSDLQIHHRNHTGERPFKCTIGDCPDAFISKDRYEVHVEVKHLGEAPLKCEFCPRTFFRHHRLRDHKKSHTGEKSYLCEICSKAFTQPAYLKYHQTTHKELNLAEFKCDQCEKKFASPVNLRYHKETQHQKKFRYHCQVCGHGTSHMSHMKLHMRRHTGEKPHSCPLCQKCFTRGSQLKIHVRSHTGERPYPCGQCSKSFTNSSKLRRHELTHVGKVKPLSSVEVKVTPLLPITEHNNNPIQPLAHSTMNAAPTGVLLPADVVDVRVDEETNGHAVLKLEHVPTTALTEQDFQQQLITIQQPNGVTYQIIASEDGVNNETFAEYILINGDFTIG